MNGILTYLLAPLVFFSQITMHQGLPQNAVFSIAEGKDKNMWFATYGGISRYDGYHCINYELERNPNYMHIVEGTPLVFCDSRGRIWACDCGLNLYDPEEDAFRLCGVEVESHITAMAELPGGDILAVSGGEIFTIDGKTGSFRKGAETFYSGKKALSVSAGKGLVAVGTEEGSVLVYNSADLSLISEFHFPPSARVVSNLHIRNSNEVWARCRAFGVMRINLKTLSSKIYEFPPEATGNVVSVSLGENSAGEILALGRDRIFKFSDAEDRFVESDVFKSSVCHFRCMHVDDRGGMWLGSFYNGVYYYYSNPTPFSDMSFDIPKSDILICCIRETPKRKVWISTMEFGLLEYNPLNGGLSEIPGSEKVLSSGVMDILFEEDKEKVFFVNTQGLTVLDRRSGKYNSPETASGDPAPPMYSMQRENASQVWIGSLAGMYVFDTVGNVLRRVPGTKKYFIYKIFRDGKDRMWMATADGLYRADIRHHDDGSVSLDGIIRESEAFDVHDILKSQGILYVAARNGLFVLGRTGEWKQYTKKDGLSTNFLNGLEVDRAGCVWISTEFGLNSFNPADGRIHHYLKEDGVNVEYYTKNAHCRASDGMMYFGGTGGVSIVDPSIDKTPLCSENPVIKRISVNGVSQRNTGEPLRLSHLMNTLVFEFSVPNYSSGRKSTFKYRLYGADTDWRTTRNFKSVVYSSLKPGRYRLVLESSNMDGIESDESASVDIRIMHPWYSCAVAIAAYVLLALSLILFAMHKVAQGSKESARSKMNHLRVLSFTGRPVSSEDEEFMIKAINLIEENISKSSFGVEQMAGQLNMSRSSLFLRFKKITGGSVMDVIKRIRFEKACALLSGTDKTMEEISGEVGFRNASYFTCAFKQFFGETPARWRDLNR